MQVYRYTADGNGRCPQCGPVTHSAIPSNLTCPRCAPNATYYHQRFSEATLEPWAGDEEDLAARFASPAVPLSTLAGGQQSQLVLVNDIRQMTVTEVRAALDARYPNGHNHDAFGITARVNAAYATFHQDVERERPAFYHHIERENTGSINPVLLNIHHHVPVRDPQQMLLAEPVQLHAPVTLRLSHSPELPVPTAPRPQFALPHEQMWQPTLQQQPAALRPQYVIPHLPEPTYAPWDYVNLNSVIDHLNQTYPVPEVEFAPPRNQARQVQVHFAPPITPASFAAASRPAPRRRARGPSRLSNEVTVSPSQPHGGTRKGSGRKKGSRDVTKRESRR